MLSLLNRYLWALVVWLGSTWLLAANAFPIIQRNMRGATDAAMLLIAVIIFILCMGGAFLLGPKRPKKALAVQRVNTRIDPRKWSFDPDTGEYYRVTFDHPEGRLVDPTPYSRRLVRRLVNIQSARQMRVVIIIFTLLSISLGLASWFSANSDDKRFPQHSQTTFLLDFLFVLSVLPAALLIVLWLCVEATAAHSKAKIGPRPLAPLSPQDAIDDDPDQARQPSPQEMMRAINARGGHGREPEFPA